MVIEYEANVLYRPETAALRFLPEGPFPCGENSFSWVGIQHGPDATTGSLNLFDLDHGENRSIDLAGRPGFAFPTNHADVFVIGLERRVQLFDLKTGRYEPLCDEVETDVEGTIINDGVAFDGGLVFGCKDLKFAEQKAGLYFFRHRDRHLFRLRGDQTCSNGKVISRDGDVVTLLDIDTPRKVVVAYTLDVDLGELRDERVVVDLRDDQAFPDGMVGTADGSSVIISFYNPNDAEHGETRQYGVADGKLEAIWKTPGSPQATCPQLIRQNGAIQLIITTAVEHMPADRQSRHPNAGCLFIADTPFDDLPDQPPFVID